MYQKCQKWQKCQNCRKCQSAKRVKITKSAECTKCAKSAKSAKSTKESAVLPASPMPLFLYDFPKVFQKLYLHICSFVQGGGGRPMSVSPCNGNPACPLKLPKCPLCHHHYHHYHRHHHRHNGNIREGFKNKQRYTKPDAVKYAYRAPS